MDGDGDGDRDVEKADNEVIRDVDLGQSMRAGSCHSDY